MTTTNDSSTTESHSTNHGVWYAVKDNDTPGQRSLKKIRSIVVDAHGVTETRQSDANCWHLTHLPFRLGEIRSLATASVPIIVSIMGSYRSWASRRQLISERDFIRLRRRAMDRLSSRLSTTIVYLTEAAREAGEAAGIPSDRTRVIPLGYDRESYRDTTPTETDDPFVLCVTNHDHPRKNVSRMLETMRRSDIRFVCVGSAWEHHAAETPSNATVTGYIPEEELIDYYNRAMALYYPSVFEGFGLPIVEAMACGTPVVTSDTGAMAEVSDDGGIQVPAKDITEHISALERLTTEREYRLTCEERARERATDFSWQQTAQEYGNLYQEVTA